MSTVYGGHIKDAVGSKRRFPGRRKREVTVLVDAWYGAAHHYYAKLREEDNPILCDCPDASNKKHDHVFWDDEKSKGRVLEKKFSSKYMARQWVKEMFAKNFSLKTHRPVEDMTGKPLRWFYRDGD